jgi:hypothetical protein
MTGIKYEFMYVDFPKLIKEKPKSQPHLVMLDALNFYGDEGWSPVGEINSISMCILKRELLLREREK